MNAWPERAYPDMYGITVHANVISMILNRSYIDRLPEWANFLMYAFVTFLKRTYYSYNIAEKRRTWYDVITKPFQIVELVLFLAIPVWVLYYWNFQVDISNILITVAFAGDITELYASTIRGFAVKQNRKSKVTYPKISVDICRKHVICKKKTTYFCFE